MKKYAQILIVLGLFFGLVWWRNRHSDGSPTVSLPASTTSSSLGSTATGSSGTTSSSVTYKDGTYTGTVADAFYGNVQIQLKVSGGKITDVIFLQHPNDNFTSQRINNQAMPLLKQEVLQAQSANIDGVTGASATSGAFAQSLSSALSQAS